MVGRGGIYGDYYGDGREVNPVERPVVHCWADGPRTEDDCGTTCMLLDGHTGPHQWTRDDGIGVSFPELKI